MGQMPSRPTPATLRETLDEIHARRRRADDEHREQLGSEPWEVLEYLRRHPATRPEDIAADGQAALVLLAELRWQLLEHEQAHLMRLEELPTYARPTNAQVGALLGRGLHRQSVRDRRDRNTALLRQGWGTEHDTRAARAATRLADAQAAAEHARLDAHAEHLHTLRGQLLHATASLVVSDSDVRDWLAECERDHHDNDCSRQSLAVLGVTAASLRASEDDMPTSVRTVCLDIAQLRAIVRDGDC